MGKHHALPADIRSQLPPIPCGLTLIRVWAKGFGENVANIITPTWRKLSATETQFELPADHLVSRRLPDDMLQITTSPGGHTTVWTIHAATWHQSTVTITAVDYWNQLQQLLPSDEWLYEAAQIGKVTIDRV